MIKFVVVGLSVLAGIVPAAASLAPQAGEGASTEREMIAPADASNSEAKGDCRALQCGLLDQRAASRAVAIAAGTKPVASSYSPSMFPATGTGSSAGTQVASPPTSGQMLGAGSATAGVEPALFSVIAPGSASTQLCIDSGNLLGLPSSCKPAIPPAKHCEIFTDDQNPACRPGIPEPGTLLLLGMGLLGLVAVRGRAAG